MIRRPVFAHRTTFVPERAAGAQWATIRLSGELDLESGAEFDTVVELGLACRPAGIRVDLTDLRFMDCAGMRHLENAAEAAARAGLPFSLCGTRQPLVDRLLRLTGSPLLPASGGAGSGVRGGPDPVRTGLSEALHGYWERVLRMSMLTVAGGTILSSLLMAALVQAD
ncbi:STAS domain-containing protein [Streptomyces uncialis]|uniref:STAS domain-containing protein n=1 Tax=Streptomyces uncialis TaxID=1048205 RepID=UPI0033D306B1